jgi:hypothetical protein
VRRAFRLYLSSKFGKTACLRLTNRFGGATLDPQAAFHQLLISVLHHSSSSALAPLAAAADPAELAQQRQQQWRKGTAAVSGSTTWPVSLLRVEEPNWQQELVQLPLTWQQVPMLLLNPTPHNSCSSQQLQDGQQVSWQHQEQQQHAGWSAGRQHCDSGLQTAGAVVCYGPSPFPLLEQFITSICVQVWAGKGTQGMPRVTRMHQQTSPQGGRILNARVLDMGAL